MPQYPQPQTSSITHAHKHAHEYIVPQQGWDVGPIVYYLAIEQKVS